MLKEFANLGMSFTLLLVNKEHGFSNDGAREVGFARLTADGMMNKIVMFFVLLYKYLWWRKIFAFAWTHMMEFIY